MTKKQILDEDRQEYGGMALDVARGAKGLREGLRNWRSYGEVIGHAKRGRSLARLREYLLHCKDAVELTEKCRQLPQKP